jgi:SAM-dependent methyltransferase
MADRSFRLLSRAYDLLYAGKDYAGEAARAVALAAQCSGRSPASVLELGSGTGGHAVHLAAAGIEVVGVEASPDMIARAPKVPGVRIVEGDARSVRLGRTFDAVLALFHVASYQAEDADLAGFLATGAAHLAPGGAFVFDAWYSPAVLHQRPGARTRHVAGEDLEVTRQATAVEDVDRSLVDVQFTIEVRRPSDGSLERGEEVHRMRHLTSNEVRSAARAAGMTLIHAEGFPDGAPPSRDTWGVAFVLRRDEP